MSKKPVGLIQHEKDVKMIKDFLQKDWGDILSDEALLEAGVLFFYEQMRDNINPPHNVEVAFRRITTDGQCAIESLDKE